MLFSSSFGQQWLSFPVGTNNYNGVSIGDLDIQGNALTIEALVTPKYSTSIYYDIVTKLSNNVNCNYYLRTTDFAIRTSTAFVSLLNPMVLCLDSTYHLAGTYDGDSMKYFVNGKQVASQHISGNMVQNNLNTTIGNTNPPSGYFEQFIGYLDEVRIWDVTRTQSQIASNEYNLPTPTNQVGLKAYYKPGANFTNLQGNPAWDGTIFGSQLVQAINPYFNAVVSTGFCNPVGLYETFDKTNFKVYPNPSSNGIFTIDFPEILNCNFEVFNQIGEKVIQMQLINSKTNEINLSNFSNGIYLIKINTSNVVFMHKLVKN